MTKTRILVLGGGMASLAAVYEITSRPGWEKRFQITVLQQGWRLGGKCASSRNPSMRQRNEEHGLHVLGGFYHNTFAMLRGCYAEWAEFAPHAILFDQAFEKQPTFYLMQKMGGGWAKPLQMQFPFPEQDAKEPGVDPTRLTPLEIVKRLFDLANELATAILPDSVVILSSTGPVTFKSFMPQVRDDIAALEMGSISDDIVAPIVDSVGSLQAALAGYEPAERRLDTETALVMLELALVVTRGALEDRVVLHGFDRINDLDSLAWLRMHGGSPRLLRSTLVNSGYEWAFAYADGRPEGKDLAAGVALRGFMRMIFTYHGAPFIHMRGGMGEIVVTPLYEVLKQRGVDFRYFHEVTGLVLHDDRDAIARVTGVVQAVTESDGEYEPLVLHQGRMVWPERPKFSGLQDGDGLDRSGVDFESAWSDTSGMVPFSLEEGRDFDVVVLGISVGALRTICGQLSQRVPRWNEFLEAQKTAPTIAIQTWLMSPLHQLGTWSRPPLLTGFEWPLSSWCDMSFLLPWEEDRTARPYGNLSYFCGPFPRNTRIPTRPALTFPATETARARSAFEAWNRHAIAHLLPNAGDAASGAFDPAQQADIYVRLNINPTDEYVLSTAGSIDKRLRTDDTGVSNLFIVGDWIRSGIDAGAVEVAVTSGRQCARAITGFPQYIYGESDFA